MLHLVWSLSMPLFSSPDEPANFIKASAVIRGELVGRGVPANLQISYWTTRVDIDPKFTHAHSVPTCFAFKSDTPACDAPLQNFGSAERRPATNVGRYPPLAPAIAGVGTFFGVDDRSVYGARIVLAAVCSFLISLGLVVFRRRGVSGSAVLLALFPGTVFLASTMSPSGLEIAGAIALWCGLLSIDDSASDRLARWAVLLGGLALIGARPIGFVVYAVVLCIAALATRRARALWLCHGRSMALHAIAIAFMVTWYVAVYDEQSSSSLVEGTEGMPLSRQITHGIESIPRMIDESLGNFGWLDTPMPRLALYLLVGLISAGISLGLRGAHPRSLLALALCTSTVAVMVVVIDVNYYGLFRLFGVQGRHVAPLLVGAILIATSRLSPRVVQDRAFAFGWALLLGWSAWGALRRYVVGIRPDNVLDMFVEPQWTPLLGLWPSLILLLAAPLLVAVVATTPLGQHR